MGLEERLAPSGVERIRDIIRLLRGENGSPWDRVLTEHSMMSCLLEETYELAEGIEKNDIENIVEEIGDDLVSIVEIKNTDWDNIKIENIRRNVKRQARQIWGYIEYQTDSREVSVSPGIIFPNIPKDPERLKLIESLFDHECVQVVWESESIDEVRTRMMNKPKSE